MILTDNRNVLRMKDRELLNIISEWDLQQPTGQVIVEQAKTGVPTIKIVQDGKTQYLQSKYDPQREAQRFAGKFAEESINYVLFVGIGTAYHIEAFIEDHPDVKFAIYEPNEEVLHAYLSNFRMDKLPVRNLLKLFTGMDQEQVTVEVQQLLAQSNNVLKIITLPVYEKIYGDQVNSILEKALEAIKHKHSSLATNVAFQKRWTINSIKNFPTVLQTPNILHDIDRSAFEGKPAIIVAAGPSLNEEFENLRYIKEHGLAYIFSVGSAINALIEQGIYPDAACTYDPTELNQIVFAKLKEKDIKEIPLIFGSSVGYETLVDYPGNLFHMLTNQDTISPNYLEHSDQINVVSDAPSIAVVTFQLLAKLGCAQIILVGQNLAYQDNRRYAEGIQYDHVQNELSEIEQKNTMLVKDVYGNSVQTNEGFIRMRQQIEMYISHYRDIKVFNTTKHGAHIEGSVFVELKSMLEQNLKENVVKDIQIDNSKNYNLLYIKDRIIQMERNKKQLERNLQLAFNILRRMNSAVKSKQTNELDQMFNQLDDQINSIRINHYQSAFIEPMLRVHQERMIELTREVRYEKNLLKKGERIAHIFMNYILDCKSHIQSVSPYVKEMHDEIVRLISKEV
ncbi:motility associated factor glycosyltransferase family protein [Sporosarcina sp. P19]|uniref:motility associated factor glycosyltransferase family protein n=1 Tax=Sporosarcina sp. P19 TaxID=2048258 RepID=UPI0013041D6C|nr:6-hydroxymethylpterin diphosphokinase MptE-like protein [Sporosarcina sp. P19]